MRIFISYKRGVQPDEPVAMEIYQRLGRNHEVFIDQTMAVGTPWAQRIDQELRRSDFLVLLLSADSVESEMVGGEIETAQRRLKEAGRPRILPVRLAYSDPFPYPLSAYLNPINWALWDGPADTDRLIEELERAIGGEPLAIATNDAKRTLTTCPSSTASTEPSGAAAAAIPAQGPRPRSARWSRRRAPWILNPASTWSVTAMSS